MKFFFDENISPRLVDALRIINDDAHHEFRHLKEDFKRDTPDPEWLIALGQRGDWIVISGDKNITRGTAEQQAWRESGLTAFFFGSGWTEQNRWVQAASICHWWRHIVRNAKTARRGTGYLIPLHAKKEMKRIYLPVGDEGVNDGA